MGYRVPPLAISPDVLLQLLVGFFSTGNRSFVVLRQLSRTSLEDCLPADLAALHVDRGTRDPLLVAARISARILRFLPGSKTKRSAVSTGDYSPMGKLPGSRLCLENHSRRRRRAQHFAAIHASQ